MALPAEPPRNERVGPSGFFAFLASMFLSRIADQVLLFLVPLVVFRETGDVAWSGWAFTAEALPRFLAFPLCGALCDRVSPLRLLHLSQALRAVVCLVGLACALQFGGIAWLVALSAVCGVLTTQGVTAREVILPRAFPALRFEKVLAYSQIADQLGAVIGPVLAGVLMTAAPWPLAVASAAGLFFAADIALGIWRRRAGAVLPARSTAEGTWLAALQVALRHIVRTPVLRRLVVQAAGVNLVVGITLASSAAIVTGSFGRSAGDYAALQMAGAVATVVVLVAIAHSRVPAARLGLVAYLVLVSGGLLMGLLARPWAYAVGYLAVIGFDKMFNIYLRSTRQPAIAPDEFGKTTGLMTLLNNASQPLAGMVLGVSASVMTPAAVVVLLSVVMAVLGGLSLLLRAPSPAHTQ